LQHDPRRRPAAGDKLLPAEKAVVREAKHGATARF
jgi:hypothetical protein